MATITYHKSHKVITNEGKEYLFQTQLYKIGVYGILNNIPNTQGTYAPQKIKSMEKEFKKQLDNKEIKEFELGIPITVTNKTGMWEEVIN